MRRLLGLGLLVLCLTACIPTLTATPERDGEEVIVILEAAAGSLHAVTLSVLNATSEDERCVTLGEVDLGCVIGDIPEGERVVVRVTPTGEFYCSAFGFVNERLGVRDYRVFACEGVGS